MKTEVFVICDAATDSAGKLNILGAFDTVYAGQTPATHPSCAVACRLRFDKSEEGKHTFKILIIDQDGSVVAGPIEGELELAIGQGLDSAAINLIVNFQGLQLKRYGENRIDLVIDRQKITSAPLYVRRVQRQSQ